MKVQTIICDRLAVFLRVRTRNVAPETGTDVILPKLHYVNGHHAENGTEHVPAVENNDVGATERAEDGLRSTSDVLCSIRDLLETRCLPSSPPDRAERSAEAAASAGTSSVERLLASMNDQLETKMRVDAQLRRQADKDQQTMNEWVIAAAVIDRICFIVFSCILVIGTGVLFVLATLMDH